MKRSGLVNLNVSSDLLISYILTERSCGLSMHNLATLSIFLLLGRQLQHCSLVAVCCVGHARSANSVPLLAESVKLSASVVLMFYDLVRG